MSVFFVLRITGRFPAGSGCPDCEMALDSGHSIDAAARFAEQVQARGGTVVFTNGVFDLLHPGHVRYLRDARRLGGALIVGLNSDRSVRANKGPKRPITPESERAEILLALECVDAVAIFDDDTPAEIIRRVQPDVL